jgi:hypothetical protein
MRSGILQDQMALSRLVGSWEGVLRYRVAADRPFLEVKGTSDNRWVQGGRFVEMTLRGGPSGDGWSAVLYIGYERRQRRHVLVSLEPGDRHVTIRRGEWAIDPDRLVLVSQHRDTPASDYRQSRVVCDLQTPGALKLELAEEHAPGLEFVRFSADYRPAPPAGGAPPAARSPRRFVIA